MTDFDTRKIETARINRLEGTVPFSVVFLPSNMYEPKSQPKIFHDSYFLRTGEKREQIVKDAILEFEKYGLPENMYNPNWVSGNFLFKEGEVVLELDKDTLKGFNFWVPQGILGEALKEKNRPFSKISTNIGRTRKLYKNAFHDIVDVRETEEGLVEMLRSETMPCSIILTSDFLDKSKIWDASRGRLPGNIRIMNYGRIWDRFSTYFEDPDNGEWYQLLNKDCISKSSREQHKRIFSKALPEFGKVSRFEGFTFRECDKVPCDRNFLYFDGSIQDVFKLLQESGVKFEDGIIK